MGADGSSLSGFSNDKYIFEITQKHHTKWQYTNQVNVSPSSVSFKYIIHLDSHSEIASSPSASSVFRKNNSRAIKLCWVKV